MPLRQFKPYLILIALLSVTVFLLAFTVDVRGTNEAGILVRLPDQVGDWTGDEMRFCQNRECQQEFYLSQLEGKTTCPTCGSALGTMSYIEAQILPNDTEMLKKRYELLTGNNLFVSIVMSGLERDSIHRPELCLTGQGFDIVGSSVLDVPMDGRENLQVMVLDTIRKIRGPDGRQYEWPGYYAYWFVGKDRETPHHLMRMWWMSMDRILHNVAHRWAYISVAGQRREKDESYKEDIAAFVHDLYPQILIHKDDAS